MTTDLSRRWVETHYPDLVELHSSTIRELPDLRDFKSQWATEKQAPWSEELAWQLYASELESLSQTPYEADLALFEQLYDWLLTDPPVSYDPLDSYDEKLEKLLKQREKLRLWAIAYPVVSLVAFHARVMDLRLAMHISHPHIDLLLAKQKEVCESTPWKNGTRRYFGRSLFPYCSDIKTAEAVLTYTKKEDVEKYLCFQERNRPIVQALWKAGRRDDVIIASLTTCVCEEEMIEAIKEVIKRDDNDFAINLAARSFYRASEPTITTLCNLVGTKKVVEYFWEQITDRSYRRWCILNAPSKILLLGRLGELPKDPERLENIKQSINNCWEYEDSAMEAACREAYQRIGIVF